MGESYFTILEILTMVKFLAKYFQDIFQEAKVYLEVELITLCSGVPRNPGD